MSLDAPAGNVVGEAFRPPATVVPPWLPVRRRNRLPLDAYEEPGSYFVTVATYQRERWFTEPALTRVCIEDLHLACRTEGFVLEAFCFMPDHVHVLVSTEESRNLIRLVHRFKQRTGWWFRNRYGAGGLKASPTADRRPTLWQRSFYDHVLRRDEDEPGVVRYILENPVLAGLAPCVGEYPFAWSLHPLAP
jgi:putative transposase